MIELVECDLEKRGQNEVRSRSETSDLDAKPVASKSAPSLEPSSTTPKKAAPKSEMKKAEPLSPYIAYEDLKPPTSPTPTAPSGKKDSIIVDGLPMSGISDAQTSTSGVKTGIPEMVSAPEELSKARPLSPYVDYEDLKPPSSPSPTTSGPKEVPSSSSTTREVASQLTGGNDVAKTPDTSPVEK